MDFRTFPAAPKVSLGMVDVRDVARAHIRAMESGICDGERILITSIPSVWFSQITQWLSEEFKSQGAYAINNFCFFLNCQPKLKCKQTHYELLEIYRVITVLIT